MSLEMFRSSRGAALAAVCSALVACGGGVRPDRPDPIAEEFRAPKRVAGLALDRIHVYPQAEWGTQYTYGAEVGDPFDVYIYPVMGNQRLNPREALDAALAAQQREFEDGVAEAVKQGFYESATSDDSGTLEVRFDGRCLPGRFSRMFLVKDGVPFASDFYGFAAYGHFIKFRISRPVDGYAVARNQAFVEEFMAKVEPQDPVLSVDPDAGVEAMAKQLIAGAARLAARTPAWCDAPSDGTP